MKRSVAVIAGITALVSMAPTSVMAAPQGSIEFAFWGSATEATAIKQTVAVFEKAHPEIKVTPIWIQSNYNQKLLTMIAGGTAPDVMLVSNTDLPGYVQSFSPVKINKNAYSSTKIYGPLELHGQTYAYPFVVKPKVMAVNLSLFQKSHVPLPNPTKPMKTQQFQTEAIKLTSGSGKSKIFGSAPLWFGGWILQFGGQMFSADGTKSTIDSAAAINAANFVIDSSAKYGYAPTAKEAQGQDMFQWFMSGKVALYPDCGPWYLPQLKTVTNFKWEVVQDPGHTPPAEIDGLAVSNSSNNADAANAFAQYLSTNTAAQNVLGSSPAAIGVPVISSAVPSFVKAQPGRNLQAYIASANSAPLIGTPQHNSNQIISENWTEINNKTALGTGKESPATAFHEIAANINKMLKQ